MTDEDLWQRWFTGTHPMADLARWACGLRTFRFCRAYGGHANDGDLFLAALRYDGEADLLAVFAALGIVPDRLPEDVPQPVAGQSYTAAEYNAFPYPVKQYPTIRQPGHVRLAGSAAYVWASAERVEIHVSDEADLYSVSEASFEAARRIEPLFAPLADRAVDPPRDSRHCLSPAFYPGVFAVCGEG